MELREAIIEGLKNGKTVDIKYTGKSDSLNRGFLVIEVGEWNCQCVTGSVYSFTSLLDTIVKKLKEQYPTIRVMTRNIEIHILYHGFNSVHHDTLPYCVTIDENKQEKTGKRNDAESVLCKKMGVLEYLKEHPDYEFYFRSGLGYRGARERKIDRNEPQTVFNRYGRVVMSFNEWLESELCSCATYDVDVIDDEVHVNTFSCNDMW